MNKLHANPKGIWVAPEHGKGALGMRRDYPRDDFGFPIRGVGKELVLDHRPQIMVENKKRYEPNRKKKIIPLPPKPQNSVRKTRLPFSNGRWSFDPSEEES